MERTDETPPSFPSLPPGTGEDPPSPNPWWRRTRTVALAGLAFVLAFSWWFVPPVWRLDGGAVTVTHWHRTKGETVVSVGPGTPKWISTKKISKHALNALVAAEDARFYSHVGIDPVEIWNSIKTNFRRGRFARGGSTITQQVVKVAFLSRKKTLVRKAREAVGALLLEILLPKSRILEWYINLVEFGDGVYGIKEGCWHYFKTKPSQLTIQQAVHLALVLPSPNKWSKGLRARRLTDFGHKRFKYILNRMRRMGFITEDQWRSALATGDFGRPIEGYQKLTAAPEEEEPPFCEGPECEEEEDPWDVETDDLTFPQSVEPGETLATPEAAGPLQSVEPQEPLESIETPPGGSVETPPGEIPDVEPAKIEVPTEESASQETPP